MRVVELFAGIGGFRIACDRLRLVTVWANDNSPQACNVYRTKFGSQELFEGDVRIAFRDIPKHDLLTGGFPCQPFSNAGKKRGVEDPRGTLFRVIVDILEDKKPKHFVLENVKRLLTMDRGRHFATILDALTTSNYLVEWRLVNAMHLGLPQNRQRVFIVGTRQDEGDGGTRIRLTSRSEFAEVPDLNADLLCSPSSWPEIMAHGSRFPGWGLAHHGRFFSADVDQFADKKPDVLLSDILQTANEIDSTFDFTDSTIARLGTNTPVNRFIGSVEILSNQGGGARMGYTIFGINGVAPTLTSTQSRHYERYKVANRYRRLTNVEYARIQGFEDDHCAAVSPYAQYALYGNAVPPAMAEWAIGRALSDGERLHFAKTVGRQPDLFANVG